MISVSGGVRREKWKDGGVRKTKGAASIIESRGKRIATLLLNLNYSITSLATCTSINASIIDLSIYVCAYLSLHLSISPSIYLNKYPSDHSPPYIHPSEKYGTEHRAKKAFGQSVYKEDRGPVGWTRFQECSCSQALSA